PRRSAGQGQVGPAVAVPAHPRRRPGDGRRAHRDLRQRWQGMTALIFDCDGVLGDTERDGHLPAFNATFEHFGLPVRWSVEEYGRLLAIGGGKERLATLFDSGQVKAPIEERAALVAGWHKYKTAAFTDLIARGAVPPRPGIR